MVPSFRAEFLGGDEEHPHPGAADERQAAEVEDQLPFVVADVIHDDRLERPRVRAVEPSDRQQYQRPLFPFFCDFDVHRCPSVESPGRAGQADSDLKWWCTVKTVPAVDELVGHVVGEGPDQVQAEAAHRPVLQRRRGVDVRRAPLRRVEGRPVVLHGQGHDVPIGLEMDVYRGIGHLEPAVRHGVGDQLVQSQIDHEDGRQRQLVRVSELFDRGRQIANLCQLWPAAKREGQAWSGTVVQRSRAHHYSNIRCRQSTAPSRRPPRSSVAQHEAGHVVGRGGPRRKAPDLAPDMVHDLRR